MKPVGYQRLTPTSVVGLTVPAGAQVALIQAELQNVKWSDDAGNPPTTTAGGVGMVLAAGDSILYDGDLSLFRCKQQASTAVLHIMFYTRHST